MSVRAALFRFFMRGTVKRIFANVEDANQLRERMGKFAKMMLKSPDEVSVQPVTCNEVPCEWVSWAGSDENRVFLYLHGGGYVFGGLEEYRDFAWRLSKASGMRVLLVDYRLAPEHPFPAAVDDATACYRWLIGQGFAPASIAIGGDSAGGGLALACLVNLKNLGVCMPNCGILLSPWTDLSGSGDSVEINAKADPMLTPVALHRFANMYLGQLDHKAPLASPLFADLSGLPPLMVMVGSTEILLSDAERLAYKVRQAGGEVMLEVWPKMPHVWPLFAARIPEGGKAVNKLGAYLNHRTETEKERTAAPL